MEDQEYRDEYRSHTDLYVIELVLFVELVDVRLGGLVDVLVLGGN